MILAPLKKSSGMLTACVVTKIYKGYCTVSRFVAIETRQTVSNYADWSPVTIDYLHCLHHSSPPGLSGPAMYLPKMDTLEFYEDKV